MGGSITMKLMVGVILILISVVHVIYGEKKLVKELMVLKADNSLIGSLRVMSLQGGVLLLFVGLIELMIYIGAITLFGISRFFPLGIICLNVICCLIVSIFKHRELIKAMIPQLLIFFIIIIIQLLSIR